MFSFDDYPDLGVFSSRLVVEERLPILVVFHEEFEDSSDWEFLSSLEEMTDEIVHVHLAHIVELDPSVRPLADLPSGWRASRESVDDAWIREPIPPDRPSLDDA